MSDYILQHWNDQNQKFSCNRWNLWRLFRLLIPDTKKMRSCGFLYFSNFIWIIVIFHLSNSLLVLLFINLKTYITCKKSCFLGRQYFLKPAFIPLVLCNTKITFFLLFLLSIFIKDYDASISSSTLSTSSTYNNSKNIYRINLIKQYSI